MIIDSNYERNLRKKVSEMDWFDGCWNCIYNEDCWWMTPYNDKCMRYKKRGQKSTFKTYDFKEE